MQGEVLEELQHHYPLDLLMALSDAAIGAMQVSDIWSHLSFSSTNLKIG